MVRYRKLVLGFVVIFLAVFHTFFSYSQLKQDITYLIVDKTKTPWGHKFFKTFSEIWKAPEGVEGYIIIVEEKKPSLRHSWIYVSVGDSIYSRTVYATLLKPTTSSFDMQRYAVDASKRVLKYLLSTYLELKEKNEVF